MIKKNVLFHTSAHLIADDRKAGGIVSQDEGSFERTLTLTKHDGFIWEEEILSLVRLNPVGSDESVVVPGTRLKRSVVPAGS